MTGDKSALLSALLSIIYSKKPVNSIKSEKNGQCHQFFTVSTIDWRRVKIDRKITSTH